MRIAEVLGASTGGIGRHVASLAPRLVARGHEVTVYCPPDTAAAHDLGPSTGSGHSFGVEPLSRLSQVRHADLVHAHGYRAGAAALPWAQLGRVPLVVTWHNAVLARGWRGQAGRLGQRLVARGADLTLGASADLVALARSAGARHVECGPVAAPRLPAPVRSRDGYRAELGVAATDMLVVSVGRLAPQKNLTQLLDAAARLTDRPEVAFVLAGDGPLRAGLAERIRRDGSRVRLLGTVRDVASLLGAADVALLTSTWEARALVAQEALLAGVPLVSTRVGGIEELVGDAALLVGVGDVSATVTALLDLVEDPSRRAALRAAGLRRSAGWPDEDDVAADLAATYAALVTEHAAGHSTRGRRPT